MGKTARQYKTALKQDLYNAYQTYLDGNGKHSFDAYSQNVEDIKAKHPQFIVDPMVQENAALTEKLREAFQNTAEYAQDPWSRKALNKFKPEYLYIPLGYEGSYIEGHTNGLIPSWDQDRVAIAGAAMRENHKPLPALIRHEASHRTNQALFEESLVRKMDGIYSDIDKFPKAYGDPTNNWRSFIGLMELAKQHGERTPYENEPEYMRNKETIRVEDLDFANFTPQQKLELLNHAPNFDRFEPRFLKRDLPHVGIWDEFVNKAKQWLQ